VKIAREKNSGSAAGEIKNFMKTKHYFIENLAEFSEHTEALKKLEAYLNYIEGIFPVIEEVFGQVWNEEQIHIKLDDSPGGANHRYFNGSHIVEMGVYNENIQKKYPENLWGCLFHETHHAFFNPIIRNKSNRKIFNGGHKTEVFNYAFMATTYLKLKEKNKIDAQIYEIFLGKLENELEEWNREYRNYPTRHRCEYENDLKDNAMSIFQEYVDLFSADIENFSKFISYLKSLNSVFTDVSNFWQDLDEAKETLIKYKNEHS